MLEVVAGAPSCLVSQLGAVHVNGYRPAEEIGMAEIAGEYGLVEIVPVRGTATGSAPGATFFAVTRDPEYGEPIALPSGWKRAPA